MKNEYLQKYLALFPGQEPSPKNAEVETSPEIETSLLSMVGKAIDSVDSLKDESHSPHLGGEVKKADYRKLRDAAIIPPSGLPFGHLGEMFNQWALGHPFQTEFYFTNAIPLSTKPALAANLLGAYLNSNPIFDAYGPAAASAEIEVVAMISRLIGYNEKKSIGYFTYGGTGGNDAALRIGIEKAIPSTKENGLSPDIYVLSNELAHFSIDSAVADAGIGKIKNILVKSNQDNSMDIADLEKKMKLIFERRGEIAVIYATGGTTDAFGIDEVSEIRRVRDKLSEEYGKRYLPHIHADLAMGGFFSVFSHYDFENNPLGIEEKALASLHKIKERLSQTKDADSIIFDFHKLGYTPYLNSLFITKDAADLRSFTKDSPYMFTNGGGEYHTDYTKECSRIFAALPAKVNLMLLGIEGYQVILGNLIERAEQLKEGLATIRGVGVLNQTTPSPTVLFRFYRNSKEREEEFSGKSTEEEVKQRNIHMDEVMKRFRDNKKRFFFGETKRYRNFSVADQKSRVPVYALKAFMVSPYTKPETIRKVIDFIKEEWGIFSQKSF